MADIPDPDSVMDHLEKAPIVPLIEAGDTASACATARALARGGIAVVEVLLRRPGALDVLDAIRADSPDLIVGAGTVLGEEQAREAIARGSQFIVSPGLCEATVRHCQDAGIACFPGTATASEVQHAHHLGVPCVKFFPASLSGGPPMLKALAAVFGAMRFMPTGGVGPGNCADYMELPAVLACGGSWLTPGEAVSAEDYDAITRLAEDALAMARAARSRPG